MFMASCTVDLPGRVAQYSLPSGWFAGFSNHAATARADERPSSPPNSAMVLLLTSTILLVFFGGGALFFFGFRRRPFRVAASAQQEQYAALPRFALMQLEQKLSPGCGQLLLWQ